MPPAEAYFVSGIRTFACIPVEIALVSKIESGKGANLAQIGFHLLARAD